MHWAVARCWMWWKMQHEYFTLTPTQMTQTMKLMMNKHKQTHKQN